MTFAGVNMANYTQLKGSVRIGLAIPVKSVAKPNCTDHIPQENVMSSIRVKLAALVALALLALVPSIALAQARLEREGVVLYWGLVPAAIVSQTHALQDMHGVVPKDGGQVHHLVVALFDANGKRIEDAVVRAQLNESGVVDAAPKYLTSMSIDGQASYGQLFSTVRNTGPYRFRVLVKLRSRAAEIEFTVSAWAPHRAPG